MIVKEGRGSKSRLTESIGAEIKIAVLRDDFRHPVDMLGGTEHDKTESH